MEAQAPEGLWPRRVRTAAVAAVLVRVPPGARAAQAQNGAWGMVPAAVGAAVGAATLLVMVVPGVPTAAAVAAKAPRLLRLA